MERKPLHSEDQISKSFRDTLLHADNTQEKALEIGAFLRTLKSPPSWRTLRDEVDTDQIIKGKRLFRELGCQECHRPPTYTSDGRYKVGIQDEAGEADFNPPSLRGSARGMIYFTTTVPIPSKLFWWTMVTPIRPPPPLLKRISSP